MIMPRSGPGRDGALLSCRPELKGTRPSRPRPWQAVAVAETAGYESGGGSVTGAPRTLAEVSPRHGDVGKSRVPPVFHNDHPGEFALIVAIRRKVRTHPSPDLALSGQTVTEVRTSSRPCPRFPTKPSRPGRLVAATACPGRHETPGTQLGRPPWPRSAPSPTATATNRAVRPHRNGPNATTLPQRGGKVAL